MSATIPMPACTIATLSDILRRRSEGGNGLAAGVPGVSTGVVANPDIVRRLDDPNTASVLTQRLLLYDAQGVVLPIGGNLNIAIGRGQRPAYIISPKSLAYGRIGDINAEVDAGLGFKSTFNYLQAHYPSLDANGWWTALLDNRIRRN